MPAALKGLSAHLRLLPGNTHYRDCRIEVRLTNDAAHPSWSPRQREPMTIRPFKETL